MCILNLHSEIRLYTGMTTELVFVRDRFNCSTYHEGMSGARIISSPLSFYLSQSHEKCRFFTQLLPVCSKVDSSMLDIETRKIRTHTPGIPYYQKYMTLYHVPITT